MRPAVRGSLGILPLQDHRKDVDPAFREAVMAARIINRDKFGRFAFEGHEGDESGGARTAGDLLGGLFWPPANRDTGMWSFAVPAVVLEDEDPPASPSAGTPTSEPIDPRTTRTRPQGQTGPSIPRSQSGARRILVQPVGDDKFTPDTRFSAIKAAVPPDAPRLTKGAAGVVLIATQESRQIDLFLPTGGGNLVAVNAAGDPKKSSIVYDLRADDSLDPDRGAPLHTSMRVIPVAQVQVRPLTTGPLIAWQLGLSGRDARSGHGLVVDAPAGPLAQATEDPNKPKPEDTGGTRTRDPGGTRTRDPGGTRTRDPGSQAGQTGGGASGGGNGTGGSSDPIAAAKSELAALYERRRFLEYKLGAVIAASRGNMAGTPGGLFEKEVRQIRDELDGVNARIRQLEQFLAESSGQTKTRDRPESSNPPAVAGKVSASVSSKLSGPLEVGGANDVHRIGTDKDGHPINACHLSTGSLWYGSAGDAPMAFEPVAYSNPGPLPLRAPVHLRINNQVQHAWAGGVAPGMWQWEAEVPGYTDPDPWVDPQPPPNTSPPAGGAQVRSASGGSAGGAGWGAGTVRSGYALMETRLGLPQGVLSSGGQVGPTTSVSAAGAAIAAGLIGLDGQPKGQHVLVGDSDSTKREKLGGMTERPVMFPAAVHLLGGMTVRARGDLSTGPDYSSGGPVGTGAKTHLANAPAVAVLEGFATGTSRTDGKHLVAGTGRRFGSVPRAQKGAIMPLPPGVKIQDVAAGLYSSGEKTPQSTAVMLAATGLMSWDVGTPDRTNLVTDGARFAAYNSGGKLAHITSDGSESSTTRYSWGEGGHDFRGAMALNKPVTMDEQGSTPSTPNTGKRKIYAKSDGWYDLDAAGTETKIGAASSATREVLKNAYQASGTSMSYTLAAGKLAATGDRVVITYQGDGGVGFRTPRVAFGSTQVSGGASAPGFTARLTVVRTGATTQDVFFEQGSTLSKTTAAETLSGTVSITCDFTNASGATANALTVEYIPAT